MAHDTRTHFKKDLYMSAVRIFWQTVCMKISRVESRRTMHQTDHSIFDMLFEIVCAQIHMRVVWPDVSDIAMQP